MTETDMGATEHMGGDKHSAHKRLILQSWRTQVTYITQHPENASRMYVLGKASSILRVSKRMLPPFPYRGSLLYTFSRHGLFIKSPKQTHASDWLVQRAHPGRPEGQQPCLNHRISGKAAGRSSSGCQENTDPFVMVQN